MSENTLAGVDTGGLPTVVIIGRPNVGKSTLFNRIIGSQQAIVEDRPGITRDRKVLEATWLEVPFLVIDTGGWMPTGDGTALDDKVSKQVEEAVDGADVVLFVVDASVGLTDDDSMIANWLRRTRRDVLVIANKADNDRRETDRWEFLSLGLGDPIPVSALHGRRAGDLLDQVIARFPEEAASPPRPRRIRAGRRLGRRRRDRGAAHRDRGAAQRRQEHAVQPVGRLGTGGGPRHGGHHA